MPAPQDLAASSGGVCAPLADFRSIVDFGMRITDAHIAEFQRLYLETFKEEISHADAHARLIGLTRLYQNLADRARKTPIRPPDEDREAKSSSTGRALD